MQHVRNDDALSMELSLQPADEQPAPPAVNVVPQLIIEPTSQVPIETYSITVVSEEPSNATLDEEENPLLNIEFVSAQELAKHVEENNKLKREASQYQNKILQLENSASTGEL